MGGRIWISQAENSDQLLLGSHYQMMFSSSLKWDEGGQHLFGSQQEPSKEANSTNKWNSCLCNSLLTSGRRDTNSYARAKSRKRLYHFSKLFYSSLREFKLSVLTLYIERYL